MDFNQLNFPLYLFVSEVGSKMHGFSFLFTTLVLINSTLGQCPWQKDVPELQTACLCAYNLGHELSVQCDQVMYSPLWRHASTAKRLDAIRNKDPTK